MNRLELGKLEKLDLRSYWRNESQDFTPWLAQPENIRLLGEALGLELEVDSVEKSVGSFYADILCKDVGQDSWVLIENQLEPTDHTHLGQVITYSAGLEARTIVWIAGRFTSEHRAALDWLNEITGEDSNFFGVEVELWRIGLSAPAPKFNVVCKPNDWSKTVQTSARRGELTEAKQLQLDFWIAFSEFMTANSSVRCQKPQPRNYMSHSIGVSGFHLDSVASMFDSAANRFGGELRVELIVMPAESKAAYAQLEAHANEVEKEIGEPLTWYNPPAARMCRVYVRQTADIAARERWPEYHAWLKERLERFLRVFGPRVKALEF